MSKAADEYEDIARRLKELEADRQLALTGSSAEVSVINTKGDSGVIGEYAVNWAYGMGADYDPA